jgi:hypothetical protein
MSEPHNPELLFWNRVLTLSESLEATDSADSMKSQLLALEEGFHDAFDPADSFQAYVTLNLCRSLRRGLEGAGERRTRRS